MQVSMKNAEGDAPKIV